MASLASVGNDLYTGRRSFDFVGRRRTWFVLAIVLMLVSTGILLGKGLNPGIDFRGGSQFTVSGVATTDQSLATDVVTDLGGEAPRVAEIGSSTIRVQTSELSDQQTRDVSAALAEAYDVPAGEVTASFVGPTWGADVTRQALLSLVTFLVIVSVVMVLYFRAWTFAAGAILALLHDVVLTVGIYALIGFEVTPSSVIGFLTILGYSLYDTVVVFDKVRENTEDVLEQGRDTYAERSNLAVNQTLVRSINTSVTGLLPVAAILVIGVWLLGASTLGDIALALFIGMLLSTVSSVFIAAPAEVSLRMLSVDHRQHTEDVLAERTPPGGPSGAATDERKDADEDANQDEDEDEDIELVVADGPAVQDPGGPGSDGTGATGSADGPGAGGPADKRRKKR